VDDLAYLERLQRIPSPLLLEMEQRGDADGVPSVARETGRLLSTLVHAMQANRILELGTAHGYSTLWMALALPVAGHIWTIDPDSARTQVARTFFERSARDGAIEIINQPALDVLPTFPVRNLDIVFIDADPSEYVDYLGLAVPLLKRSGLVVVDNLLVPARKSLREFVRIFLNHPELDATILPLGYGIGIGARLG
jgi:predicted O-methyltransferase YrrM